MVSHSPHTNLSLGNFGGKFCYLRKSIDNDIAHRKIFPTSLKMCPKFSKTPVKEFIYYYLFLSVIYFINVPVNSTAPHKHLGMT